MKTRNPVKWSQFGCRRSDLVNVVPFYAVACKKMSLLRKADFSGMLVVQFDEYFGQRLKAAQFFGMPLFEMVGYLFERMDSIDEFFDFTK
jgi:hypothetical protein